MTKSSIYRSFTLARHGGVQWVAIGAVVLGLAPGLYGQAASTLQPIFKNERVILWDVPSGASLPAALETYDSVVVPLLPAALHGQVIYVPKSGGVIGRLKASGAQRSAVISLMDVTVPPLENTSGYPDAFPRAGNLKKPLENERVVAWDFTFEVQKPTTMHFHTRDVVAVSLNNGDIIGTTQDGQQTHSNYDFGTIRFNPRNRLHTETLLTGEARIVVIELK